MSLSYGKDSLACLGAIDKLGWKLDRIVHAEVWATDIIPADLPPMIEFKAKADAIIKARWGIQVEHIRSQWTYEGHFYNRYFYIKRNQQMTFPQNDGIYGFPIRMGPWCNSRLKVSALSKAQKGASCIYIGIAVDEPSRFNNIIGKKKSPLVEVGWTEEYAVSGAKIIICCLQSIQIVQGADVGFATIRGLTNCGNCEDAIHSIGNCFSNGIVIAQLRFIQMDIQYTILKNAFRWKMKEKSTVKSVSYGR